MINNNAFLDGVVEDRAGDDGFCLRVDASRRPVRHTDRMLRVASLAAVVLGAGVIAGAATVKPVVVSVTGTPMSLLSAGGSVKLVVKDRHATACTITASPKITGFPRTLRCSSGGASTTASVPANTTASSETFRFQVVAKAAGGRSARRAASVSEAAGQGAIGSTLDVEDSSGDTLAVTMTQIIDPATGANEFYTPNSGDRFVAVDMGLQNPSSATITDDANLDATVIGTDSQAYTADFDSVAECTNFSSGQFTLLPGNSENGCVVFQLPVGIAVKAVQFTLGLNTADTVQWTP